MTIIFEYFFKPYILNSKIFLIYIFHPNIFHPKKYSTKNTPYIHFSSKNFSPKNNFVHTFYPYNFKIKILYPEILLAYIFHQ